MTGSCAPGAPNSAHTPRAAVRQAHRAYHAAIEPQAAGAQSASQAHCRPTRRGQGRA
jgi:hypothetical protein